MQGSPVQFEFEDLSPVEKRLIVVVAREQVNSKLDEAFRKLSREVNLRGFRKGKAPRPLLEQLFGKKVETQVAQDLVNESMVMFGQQHQMRMMSAPVLEPPHPEPRRNEPMRFTTRLELYPVIDPKDYDGIQVTRRATKVTDETVAEALEHRRLDQVEMLPIEGREVTANTDVVKIIISGSIGGRTQKEQEIAVDLTEPKQDPLPGLVPMLIGISLTAKDHEVNFTLPTEGVDPPAFAGQPVSLKVTIKEAHIKQLPALDDEFAKDTGEADTLAEMRDKIRVRLVEEDAEVARQELRDTLIGEALKRNPVPLPPTLLRQAIEQLSQPTQQRMLYESIRAGGNSNALTPEAIRAAVENEAIQSLSQQFLLNAIAEKEKLSVTEADLELRLSEMARRSDKSVARIKAEIQKHDSGFQNLRHDLLVEKSLDLLESRAKISEAQEANA